MSIQLYLRGSRLFFCSQVQCLTHAVWYLKNHASAFPTCSVKRNFYTSQLKVSFLIGLSALVPFSILKLPGSPLSFIWRNSSLLLALEENTHQ